MEIRRGDIIIRDICPSDIADHVRWRTVDTEWMNWDAPWRQPTMQPVAIERNLRHLLASPLPAVRTRFEIALDTGEHIGWMNSYYVDGTPGRLAIGIDIAEPRYRGNGRGERAFAAFIHYLFSAGLTHVYTETWSGNLPMIRVAGKCGFELVQRGHQDLQVRGEPYDSLLFCATPAAFYQKQSFEPTPDLKKPLSRCGWALTALVVCGQLGALALGLLARAFFPSLLESMAGALLLSDLSLYGLGLTALALILQSVPASPLPKPAQPPDTPALLKLLVLCLGMGYLGQLVGTTAITLFEQLVGHGYSDPLDSVLTVSSPAVIFVFVVVLGPIFEELMFRDLLLRRLLPYGQAFAIQATAIAFALFHCNISQFFYAYSVGIILAYAVISTSRLHIGILLHACFNLVGSLLMPALMQNASDMVIGMASVVILALMAGSLILLAHGKSHVRLDAGTMPLSEGQKHRLVLQSPGALVFIVLSLGLTVWTFLA